MKKIYTRTIFEFDKKTQRYVVNDNESQYHYVADDAPMSWCGGGQSGGGGQTNTVQKSDPWSGQQPYLTQGYQQVQSAFTDPKNFPQFYPGSTVVPFSPETNLALQMQESRAINGSPIQDAGTNQLTSTLSGDYLSQVGNLYDNPMQSLTNSNVIAPTLNGDYLYGGPGFNAAYQAAANKIIPQVDSQFNQAGRLHSGLADTAKTQALSDAFASQYGQERQNQLNAAQLAQQGTQTFLNSVNNERDNQIRSMLFAPQMANLDYQNIGALAQVGAQKEDQSQQNLADQIARWDYAQNQQQNMAAQYMNLIQGNYGGTTSSSSNTNAVNPGFDWTGALTGVGGILASSLLYPSAGAAAGLGAGGLLGLGGFGF